MEPKATTPGKYKEVTYYNNTFDVPDWAKFLAMDQDGSVFAYEYAPIANLNKKVWRSAPLRREILVAEFIPNPNWKDSLVEL